MAIGRTTRIVCSLGPASEHYDGIRAMADAGMDVARINFSHGTYEIHLRRIKLVRKVARLTGRRLAILQDLPGPKIRVGTLRREPMRLATSSSVTLKCGVSKDPSNKVIPIPFAGLLDAVRQGSKIFLADGKIRLVVDELGGNEIGCTVEHGGDLLSSKGVNIPETTSGIRAVTPEDERYMRFGEDNGVDYMGISFVRNKDDILYAKKFLASLGNHVKVVAKIEKQEAIRNYKEIIRAADVVMVAHGDLGVEIGLHNVPLAQKMIIKEANRQHKPVITATQMMLSMVNSQVPTRAEVSDAANAVLDGTSALMLSEETTMGQNYVEAVRMLDVVAKTIEADPTYRKAKGSSWSV